MKKNNEKSKKISASQKNKSAYQLPAGTTIIFPDGREFLIKARSRIVKVDE